MMHAYAAVDGTDANGSAGEHENGVRKGIGEQQSMHIVCVDLCWPVCMSVHTATH